MKQGNPAYIIYVETAHKLMQISKRTFQNVSFSKVFGSIPLLKLVVVLRANTLCLCNVWFLILLKTWAGCFIIIRKPEAETFCGETVSKENLSFWEPKSPWTFEGSSASSSSLLKTSVTSINTLLWSKLYLVNVF